MSLVDEKTRVEDVAREKKRGLGLNPDECLPCLRGEVREVGKSRVGSLSQWGDVCFGVRLLPAHMHCVPVDKKVKVCAVPDRLFLSQCGRLFPPLEHLFSLLFCHLFDFTAYVSFACREVMPGT